MRWLKRGLCGIDLRKHTYIVAGFDLLLSVAGIIVGFLVIIHPENYISKVSSLDAEGAAVVDNETATVAANINETSAAATITVAGEADKDGVFSTPEQFHFVERVKDLQNQVVEGSTLPISYKRLMESGVDVQV